MVFDNMYFEYIKIRSLVERDVLLYLVRNCEYKKNKLSLNKSGREALCKSIKITASQLSRALKKLIERKLIAEKGGDYYINPLYYWKGATRERTKILDIISEALHTNGEEINFLKILAGDY